MNNRRGNRLTILICCYNSSQFLKKCLDSLVDQSISGLPYKVLFINDGSTDDSLEIANSYSNHLDNFIISNNKKNEGLTSCCNQGLNMIDTPYFMRLDADDYLASSAIEKILKELTSSEKRAFIIFKRWDVCNNEFKEADISDDIFTWIATGTVFSAEAVKVAGGYSNEYWEEYDLYIKLLKAGFKYKISPYRIYYYCQSEANMTGRHKENKKGLDSLLNKWGFEVLDKYGEVARMREYYSKRANRCQK